MTLHGAACRFRASLLTALVVFGLGGAALAQRRGFGGFPGRPIATEVQPNIEYDGRFTFVRVSYDTAPGGYWYRGLPSWAHGYPIAERNLMRIMNELTFLHAHDEGVNVLTLDDPRLFQYPIAYIIEVSWWTLTDREAAYWAIVKAQVSQEMRLQRHRASSDARILRHTLLRLRQPLPSAHARPGASG